MKKCRNTQWRTEPVDVEKSWDDLWIGAYQSNSEKLVLEMHLGVVIVL